jgi:hypothetical protein
MKENKKREQSKCPKLKVGKREGLTLFSGDII